MSVSKFERLVEDEIGKLGDAALNAPLGDSHRVAVLKGQAIGLKQSVALMRKAFKDVDLD